MEVREATRDHMLRDKEEITEKMLRERERRGLEEEGYL